MPNEEKNDDVKRRLDALIAILIQKELKEDKSMNMRGAVALLSSSGLKYGEIAQILGKSPTYIASELTLLKKRRRK